MDVLQKQRNEPARMTKLAKLPVFWALEGKSVVLAGGSDAAAWKAELLLACGAHVHVFCPVNDLSDAFLDLLQGRLVHAQAQIIHHDAEWNAACFARASLAIADCEDGDEAQRFYGAAVSAGVPVNIIDKPQFCKFQFGSIVNRSPVIVSISTDGAAPILAQAIRRKIETLLPASLQSWAQMAQSIRDTVSARLKPGAQRRAFWERFVDRAFVDAADDDATSRLLMDVDLVQRSKGNAIGRVTLVGAGPGDAELLTLKAVRALQAADVILFDDLVSDEVLELARREAKRMLVGKRGGRVSCKQEDINRMMVTFAKAGKRVVRLKSGDPMVFGRAGEEIAALEAEGIPVDIVPGITAASAMAASLGVSLTHRDHAQSVRFVTGHSRKGTLPATLDWRSLANPTVTTVFYMGGRTASGIEAHLLANGMPASTPAVVMTSVSRSSQKSWSGALCKLGSAVEEFDLDEPVLIGIGNAFADASYQMQLNHQSDNGPKSSIKPSRAMPLPALFTGIYIPMSSSR